MRRSGPKKKTEEVQAEAAKQKHPISVVGIGASAGGIDALQALVPHIPRNGGLAFVVVQHLDPDHQSALSKLLARVSPIPVVEIRDEEEIEPDHIYVIPPNATLTLIDDRLHLSGPIDVVGRRTSIDSFFTSLAETKGEEAACVILSGTGSDGTVGLRAVKELGGLTIAQAGAEYDGMMRSAVSTGLVDFVLPVEEIPAKLCNYFQHLLDIDDKKGPDGLRPEATDHLAQIYTLLRTRTGHDFSGYKQRTIGRRVQRRMQVLQIEEPEAFIARLRKDPHELDALLQDLLIGVTNFFRDPAAFEALEHEVIPQLFANKGPEDTIRVWVPGCSTGEEAYSIAILLRERTPKTQRAPKLQIFASDIDEHALQIARIGRFPATIARDVHSNRLERYFVREDGTYRINSDLREICLFSAHNLLRDAPFSKLDLISCRNLLIYLTPDLQDRIIPLFHYALNESGFLFLGTSENVTKHSRLFSTVDKSHRIFRRRAQVERRLPEFPLTAPEGARRRLSSNVQSSAERESLQSLAERQLLDRFSPAYVVINAEGDLLHASARTGKYLELAPGAPKTDVFSMARTGLRADLRAAIHKTASTGQPAIQSNVIVGTNGGKQEIDLIVDRLRPAAEQEQFYIVIFQDIGGIKSSHDMEILDIDDAEGASLRQLEVELKSTKDRLQTMTEELESSNEELKSGNEELSSMNEELQSANEELETSKEELQSINEELQTVNAELNARVEELSRANSDIANLLESTQIATVFLDRNLAVKSFTPAAKDVFRLVESDAGRPITHVRARFDSDTVQEDAQRVLRTLSTIERQVDSNYSDARYVMRMLPYRTVDNVIAGVVITFVDVTRITAAEARIGELTRDLHNRIQNLETLLDLVPVGILIIEDNRSDEIRVNRYGAHLIGEGGQGTRPRPIRSHLRIFEGDRELGFDDQPLQRAAHSGEDVPEFIGQLKRPDGSSVDVMISAAPLLDEAQKPRGGIAAIVDISESKKAESRQQVLLHELQHRVKNIIATVGALATRMLAVNPSMTTFSSAFLGRLRAMARTHELLSQMNWSATELRSLIQSAVNSHIATDENNVSLTGPAVLLSPSAATTLGMVVYELTTNASKYGSLSSSGGKVDVSWRINPSQQGEQLSLSWVESGGPALEAAMRPHFGADFIKRAVEYEFGGKVTFEMNAEGLRCHIEIPLSESVRKAASANS